MDIFDNFYYSARHLKPPKQKQQNKKANKWIAYSLVLQILESTMPAGRAQKGHRVCKNQTVMMTKPSPNITMPMEEW